MRKVDEKGARIQAYKVKILQVEIRIDYKPDEYRWNYTGDRGSRSGCNRQIRDVKGDHRGDSVVVFPEKDLKKRMQWDLQLQSTS